MSGGSAAERHWSEVFAALEGERAGEPSWLEAARKAALARFVELGIPDRRHEEWKYTDPRRITAVPWRPAPVPASLPSLAGLPLEDHPSLVFVNGRFAPTLSRLEALPPGVRAGGLRHLLARAPDEAAALEPDLGLPGAIEDRAFAALAVALAPDTAWVRVAPGVVLERPVFVVFLRAAGAADSALAPRLLVHAECGSRFGLVELHVSDGDGRHLTNALAEVRVGPNARVEHVRVQREGSGTLHLAHGCARLDRDAHYTSRTVSLGAGLARLDLVAALEGEGAECFLDGLYVGSGAQHVDCRTIIDHRLPHGTSRELYKGVLSGRARGIFNGKVIVRPDAQKTDARQKNENLLLSSHAEVDSKPQLEIEADDVRCTHGSTIGQLEEDAVFYLRARGLDAAAARGLLVRAFAAQITEALPGAALRGWIEADVLARIGAAGGEAP
jgi:Fe-S cluster assembly protein SufD